QVSQLVDEHFVEGERTVRVRHGGVPARVYGRSAEGGEVLDRAQAGKKEVLSALHPNEWLELPLAVAYGTRLDGEAARGFGRRLRQPGIGMLRDEWVRFRVEALEVRVIDPGVLHELELPRDVRVEADEVEPAVEPVVLRFEDVFRPHRGGDRRPVEAPPPEDPVATRDRQ